MAAIVCAKYISEMQKANSRLLGNHTYVGPHSCSRCHHQTKKHKFGWCVCSMHQSCYVRLHWAEQSTCPRNYVANHCVYILYSTNRATCRPTKINLIPLPQEATTGGLGASPQVSDLNSSAMRDCPAPPPFRKPPLGGWGLAPSA